MLCVYFYYHMLYVSKNRYLYCKVYYVLLCVLETMVKILL